MTYRYRVTLEGIKGFYRVYLVNATNSLYTLHKQLRADLEFPQDQQILFKAFDEAGNVAGRFALMPLPGNKAVDEVPIAETVKAGIVRYQYFYDVSSKKYVIVTFEGVETGKEVNLPEIVDSKGPLPIEFEHGYVAFEDLPDNRRRLPGEKPSGILGMLGLSDDEDLDDGDDEDDEDDENEDDALEEEDVIYDENE
ncbi:MAG: hypothetical protein IJQ22_08810 [Bacteroidales bacterium]|nr:hypothetical protein [Bacteroidales bacterium]